MQSVNELAIRNVNNKLELALYKIKPDYYYDL